MDNLKIRLRPAWRTYWGSITILAFLFLLAIGASNDDELPGNLIWIFWLLLVATLFYRRYSWLFTINNGRVTRSHGIIARNQQSVRIQDLRSIELNQGIFQRIFGVGDLLFYSAGSGEAEVRYFGIKNPASCRDQIETEVDKAKTSND